MVLALFPPGRKAAQWAVSALLAFTFGLSSSAQTKSVPPSHVLVEGEELVYNVRYTFIDLGQVKIRTINAVHTPEYSAYHAIANINSYKGIPFVDLAAVYESDIDSTVYSHVFVGKGKEGKAWNFARYVFEYDRNRVEPRLCAVTLSRSRRHPEASHESAPSRPSRAGFSPRH